LQESGVCPECRFPVKLSLQPQRLKNAGERHLRIISRGAKTVQLCISLGFLMPLVLIGAKGVELQIGGQPGSSAVPTTHVLWCGYMCVLGTGLWLLSLPERGMSLHHDRFSQRFRRWRLALRIAATLMFGLHATMLVLLTTPVFSALPPGLRLTLNIGAWLVTILGWPAAFAGCAAVMERRADGPKKRWTARPTFIHLACLVTGAVVTCLCAAASLVGGSKSSLSSASVVVVCIVAIVSLLVLLDMYRELCTISESLAVRIKTALCESTAALSTPEKT
jgi:hypothetical protein